jgi:hypothetical protein
MSKISSQFKSHKMPFESISRSLLIEIKDLLGQIKQICPQYSMEGSRNIWIVKPGALSRGRGALNVHLNSFYPKFSRTVFLNLFFTFKV